MVYPRIYHIYTLHMREDYIYVVYTRHTPGKKSNKYRRYYSAMEAHEDTTSGLVLLSPITAAQAADRSEPTTFLVSEGSGLPRVLQQAFEDGARPAPLALLAQVFTGKPERQSIAATRSLASPTSKPR
jgi:hypothetical protein